MGEGGSTMGPLCSQLLQSAPCLCVISPHVSDLPVEHVNDQSGQLWRIG